MPPLSLPAVRAAMLEKLRSSLLSERHAKILHFQPMTEADAKAAGINPPWAGFKIPYFTPDGKIDKDFYRYRFWPDSKPSKGWASIGTPAKPLRYVQPENSELHVYMPPLIDGTWREVMENPEIPLNITEGELKAACACVNTHTTLGLGGVFSWTSRRRGQELIPILEDFVWKGKQVNLIFDSDKNQKPLVQLAASRLALTLLARGAIVYDVDLPPAKDGGKQGLDDYLLASPDPVQAIPLLLANAKEVSASAELHRLNDEVAIVWSGGGLAGNVLRIDDGHVMTPQQFTKSFYKDRVYMDFGGVKADGSQAAPKTKYAAEEWLSWPNRARVNAVTYAPGQDQITDDGSYNLWQRTGINPTKGSTDKWDDLLAHVLADVTPEHLRWFKQWLAYPIQYPGTKLFSCTLIWSYLGGTGKNLLAEALVPIYGVSNCVTIDSDQLTESFNGWAEGKQWVIGDEITLDNGKRHVSGRLKSRLTNRVIRINRKGIEAYTVPDCTNHLLTSNDAASVTLEQGERRTFVIHAPEERIGDGYGREFMQWVYGYSGPPYDRPPAEGSGAAHIAYALHHQDLTDFSPTAEPPDTMAKLDLIANSRSDIESWCASLKMDPEKMLTKRDPNYTASAMASSGPYQIYTPDDLMKIYDPEDKHRVSLRAMGMCLGRVGFRKARDNNGRLNNIRSTLWIIRGDDLNRAPITGIQAAKLYAAERPVSFHGARLSAAEMSARQAVRADTAGKMARGEKVN